MEKFLCILTASAFLCLGCADAPPPRYYATAFDKTEAARLMLPGRNTVVVRAYTRDLDKNVRYTCQDKTATLIPATKRAEEYIKLVFGVTELLESTYPYMEYIAEQVQNPDPDFQKYTREEPCVSNQQAVFEKVADGEFYVIVGAYEQLYAKKIRVKGGEIKYVVFNGDFIYPHEIIGNFILLLLFSVTHITS